MIHIFLSFFTAHASILKFALLLLITWFGVLVNWSFSLELISVFWQDWLLPRLLYHFCSLTWMFCRLFSLVLVVSWSLWTSIIPFLWESLRPPPPRVLKNSQHFVLVQKNRKQKKRTDTYQESTGSGSAVTLWWCPHSCGTLMHKGFIERFGIVDVVCLYIGKLLFSKVAWPTTFAAINLWISSRFVGACWSGGC
jgi:hypothetical protein